jgi:hypothetical protein
VENLFERASSGRAAEYYGAKLLTIQLPIGQKNSGTKFAPNFLFNFRVKIDEPVRLLIGVEEFARRNDLTQTLAKAGLACGNSAGDADGSHDQEHRRSVCAQTSALPAEEMTNVE